MNWYVKAQVHNPYFIRIMYMLQSNTVPVDIVGDLGLVGTSMDPETISMLEAALQQAVSIYQQGSGILNSEQEEIIRQIKELMYGESPEADDGFNLPDIDPLN